MDVAQQHRVQKRERILERRAARARRSRWLGKLLFSLTSLGLLVFLRLNPGLAENLAIAIHDMKMQPSEAAATAEATDIRVRSMPTDAVPVRRGGASAGASR